MKDMLKKLLYSDGVISKTKLAAVVAFLVNIAAGFGYSVPGLAENMAEFNTVIGIFIAWALRDGMD